MARTRDSLVHIRALKRKCIPENNAGVFSSGRPARERLSASSIAKTIKKNKLKNNEPAPKVRVEATGADDKTCPDIVPLNQEQYMQISKFGIYWTEKYEAICEDLQAKYSRIEELEKSQEMLEESKKILEEELLEHQQATQERNLRFSKYRQGLHARVKQLQEQLECKNIQLEDALESSRGAEVLQCLMDHKDRFIDRVISGHCEIMVAKERELGKLKEELVELGKLKDEQIQELGKLKDEQIQELRDEQVKVDKRNGELKQRAEDWRAVAQTKDNEIQELKAQKLDERDDKNRKLLRVNEMLDVAETEIKLLKTQLRGKEAEIMELRQYDRNKPLICISVDDDESS